METQLLFVMPSSPYSSARSRSASSVNSTPSRGCGRGSGRDGGRGRVWASNGSPPPDSPCPIGCIVYVQLANYVYVSDLLYIANALNLQ